MTNKSINIIPYIKLLFYLVLANAFCSCAVNKYIPEDKVLLSRNIVNIRTTGASLKQLERDRIKYVVPNPRYGPAKSYLRNYFRHTDPNDSSWWDRLILKHLSEKPIWYTESEAESNKQDIIKHLNSTGYYNGEINYKVRQSKKQAKVIYTVLPGIPLRIKSHEYLSENPEIQKILDSIKPYLNLRRGMPLDEQYLILDQAKLIQAIQDAGYYQISKSNLDYYYDDTTGHAIHLICKVLPPQNNSTWKPYRISEVNVFTNERLGSQLSTLDTIVHDIRFRSGLYNQILKPSVLKKYLLIKKDSLYTLTYLQRTRNTLQNLGVYRSVTVLPEVIGNTDSIKYNLFLPANKSQFIEASFESSYVTNKDKVAGNKLFDLRFELLYRHRNLFKGAEQFTVSVVPIVGFQLIGNKLYIPWGLNATASLAFPRFIEIGFMRFARKTKLISENLYNDIKNGARTRVSFGNLYDRFFSFNELSIQRETNFNFGYEYTKNNRIFYRFNPVGIDYLNYDLSDTFKRVAPPFLLRSFEDRLLSGLLLKELTVDINNKYRNLNTSRVLLSFETSGLEPAAADLFTKTKTLPRIARFIRIEGDGRYTIKMSRTNRNSNAIGLRFATGIALPLEETTIPFVKQFYIGGPNSIRGWAIREIGPGLVKSAQSRENRFSFFQTGNLKWEFGSEYRFDIYSIFKGAVFFDGGNVWLLKKDPLIPGGELTKNFLSQMYLSSGLGLRLDLNYVLFRFDTGLKLRTPYLQENGTHNATNLPLQFNLSLGLPF